MASKGGKAGAAAARKKSADSFEPGVQAPQSQPPVAQPHQEHAIVEKVASTGLAALILSKFNLQGLAEAISLIYHGIPGVLAHVMILVPDTPIKGVGFLGILGVIVHWTGIHDPKSQPLCFGCLSFLAILSVGLIAVALRNPGKDERLQEGQDSRIRAIEVKPLRYELQAKHEDSRHNQR